MERLIEDNLLTLTIAYMAFQKCYELVKEELINGKSIRSIAQELGANCDDILYISQDIWRDMKEDLHELIVNTKQVASAIRDHQARIRHISH